MRLKRCLIRQPDSEPSGPGTGEKARVAGGSASQGHNCLAEEYKDSKNQLPDCKVHPDKESDRGLPLQMALFYQSDLFTFDCKFNPHN